MSSIGKRLITRQCEAAVDGEEAAQDVQRKTFSRGRLWEISNEALVSGSLAGKGVTANVIIVEAGAGDRIHNLILGFCLAWLGSVDSFLSTKCRSVAAKCLHARHTIPPQSLERLALNSNSRNLIGGQNVR